MSISAISGLATTMPQSGSQTSFRQAFGQLVTALDSGNLSDAQQAYSALSQLQGSQSSAGSSNSPFATVLNQIGQSLQNDDLQGAQSALASLQHTKGGHHHGGHHGGGASTASQDSSTTSPLNDQAWSSSNAVDVTA